MPNKRREFLKLASLTGISVAGGNILNGYASHNNPEKNQKNNLINTTAAVSNTDYTNNDISIIGLYGSWANSLNETKLPSFSFRREEWKNLESWRNSAKQRLTERLAIPDIGGLPKVTVKKQYAYDGLHIEEVTWQLPYGRATEAILLKPLNAKGKLPAVLAFHDHGGNKYFGCKKITKTSDDQLALMKEHREVYYSGFAWANEIAKRGYVVLVPDAFTFGSRRVMLQDVPERIRNGRKAENTETPENIKAYNDWAGEHEHVMAKSLFCAGTTWPAVFFAEDRKALDILCAREDVDASKVGCGGLSGGGIRTVFMAGLDPRIKCTVDVGFMTTWKDFLLNKSFTHTWMTYVPLLPNELDFPEILGLRAPLPTLVLNNSEDQLYTLPEMNRAENILTEVFKKAGAEGNFKCSYYPGPHKFDSQMQIEAFNWFDRWLKA
ncbi:dienelactone hydrolase family protein [Segetibacter koreensis]|uniref:dienelactone hydrolase family protein n=1 Tax=Segetibacter koreensis TaxID=398037 RepID=UPI000380C863|nr:alpha/beta hydrolase family protein [Segetibacter koreensis]